MIISQATPAIATTPSAGGPVGSSISDTASVTSGFNPTGTVTFELFAPGDTTCTGTAVFSESVPLSGGSATSSSFPTTAVGTYRWVAVYNGDANNTSVSSGCAAEPVVITQATPTIATTPSAGGPVGTPISDTATLTGGFTPSGTVTFQLFGPGNTTCTGSPVFTSPDNPLSGSPPSAASGPFTPTAVGTYRWVATYNGDTNNAPVGSGCADEPVIITQATPTITTTASAGGPVGTSISDTATVSGGLNPTGTVTFQLFPPGDTTCATAPVFTSPNNPLSGTPPSATSGSFTPTAVGTYRWVATYGGDANNAQVSSGCAAEPVVISQATPTIGTNPSAGGPLGTAIFDTATVSGGVNPTGTVTFELFAPGDTTCTGTPVFTNTVDMEVRALTVTSGSFTPDATGTYQWVATYNGDTNNAAISSACTDEPVTMGPAVSVVITTHPSAGGPIGTSISDTAVVTGGVTPTGTVTFNLFAPGDTTCIGTPAFTSTNALSGSPLTAISDSFTSAAVGTYQWVATYNGDTNNAPVSSDCAAEPVTISQATPAIATTASAGVVVGGSINDTATVTGGLNPTGTVTFKLFRPSDIHRRAAPAFISTNPLTAGSATSDSFMTTARWHRLLGRHLRRRHQQRLRQLRLHGRAGDHRPGHAGDHHHRAGRRRRRRLDHRQGDRHRRPQPDRHGHLQALRTGNTTGTGTPVFTEPVPLTGGRATSVCFTDHRRGHRLLGRHLQRRHQQRLGQQPPAPTSR